MISVLISARKNSKFLSKILFSLMTKTARMDDVEILVMMNEQDTWNKDLVKYYQSAGLAKFYSENMGMGRHGLHIYFDSLAKEAKGDWLLYLCEDHDVIAHNWDEVVRKFIKEHGYKPENKHLFVPTFNNTGSVNHILSRKFYKTLGHFARHANLDSYFNDMIDHLNGGIVDHIREPLFTDYTCNPEIMTPEHCLIGPVEQHKVLAHTPEYYEKIKQDVGVINAG